MAIAAEKRDTSIKLYQEFAASYPETRAGKKHTEQYVRSFAEAAPGYEAVLAAQRRGEDFTELALVKLLPHNDSTFNRGRGAWISPAPAITKEVKEWLKNAPQVKMKPADWPAVARDVLGLVQRAVEDPAALQEACESFSARPHSRGIQSGMISPILNALRPDDFILFNAKPREVLGFLLDEKLSGALVDHASNNAKGRAVIEEIGDVLDQFGPPGLHRAARFDMFCHWLVAVKKYPFRDVGYWKLAQRLHLWERNKEGGYVSIGWDAIGDLSGLSNTEFEQRRTETVKAHPEWTKRGLRQVWLQTFPTRSKPSRPRRMSRCPTWNAGFARSSARAR